MHTCDLAQNQVLVANQHSNNYTSKPADQTYVGRKASQIEASGRPMPCA
jgi:hypothetical protein